MKLTDYFKDLDQKTFEKRMLTLVIVATLVLSLGIGGLIKLVEAGVERQQKHKYYDQYVEELFSGMPSVGLYLLFDAPLLTINVYEGGEIHYYDCVNAKRRDLRKLLESFSDGHSVF